MASCPVYTAFSATQGPQGNYQRHPLKHLSNLANVPLFSDKINSFSTEEHFKYSSFCLLCLNCLVSLTPLKAFLFLLCFSFWCASAQFWDWLPLRSPLRLSTWVLIPRWSCTRMSIQKRRSVRDLMNNLKIPGPLCEKQKNVFGSCGVPLKNKAISHRHGFTKACLLLVVDYSLYESADALQKRHMFLPPAHPHQHRKTGVCTFSCLVFHDSNNNMENVDYRPFNSTLCFWF